MRGTVKPAPPVAGRVLGVGPAVLLGALTALRGRRIFHPVGVAYSARARVPGSIPAAALLPAGEHPAVVRFSRGAGLPRPLPDVLGVAVKLPGLGAEGRDQDFLLATSGTNAVARHLLLPALGFPGRRFSSILPYRTLQGHLLVVGALVQGPAAPLDDARAAPLAPATTVHLEIARPGEGWIRVASIEVAERLSPAASDALRFDPWDTSERLHPAGALNAIRASSYRVNQAVRSVAGWRQARDDAPPGATERRSASRPAPPSARPA